jgi:hypothetical protein
MTDDTDSVQLNLARATRIEARQFARVFRSSDGKAVLDALKRTFGWEEAGPPQAASEHPIHFWTGQRSVIKAVLDKISLGERLSDTEDTPTPKTHE